jgi:prophage regulatory protein
MTSADHFLRLPAVMARTGKSKAGIYQDIAAGTFPAPIKIGPRASAWVESEIVTWQQARIHAREHAA